MANITPIHQNHRPISLLSIVSKVLEKIIYKHIFNHVRNHISTNQSGFLPAHPAVTQLSEINHNILKDLDEKKEIFIMFCDIAKAFDPAYIP
jgi:sarcosine oxidase/L-pipecolate oxidase